MKREKEERGRTVAHNLPTQTCLHASAARRNRLLADKKYTLLIPNPEGALSTGSSAPFGEKWSCCSVFVGKGMFGSVECFVLDWKSRGFFLSILFFIFFFFHISLFRTLDSLTFLFPGFFLSVFGSLASPLVRTSYLKTSALLGPGEVCIVMCCPWVLVGGVGGGEGWGGNVVLINRVSDTWSTKIVFSYFALSCFLRNCFTDLVLLEKLRERRRWKAGIAEVGNMRSVVEWHYGLERTEVGQIESNTMNHLH